MATAQVTAHATAKKTLHVIELKIEHKDKTTHQICFKTKLSFKPSNKSETAKQTAKQRNLTAIHNYFILQTWKIPP
jgi:hypothetical protein